MGSGGWCLAALLMLGACTSPGPDFQALYGRAAKSNDAARNPVVVITGLLGSRLVDDASGSVVWGAFDGRCADPDTAAGAGLLALPMEPGKPLSALRDEVRPAGVLDRVDVDVLGLPIELGVYRKLLAALGVGGYRDESLGLSGAIDYGDEHFTCFQFGYDWRRDLVENARALQAFLQEKQEYVQRELLRRNGVSKTVKFDLVCHSMGGLLARWYLRYGDADLPADGSDPPLTWAGARLVERAILVGPPNAGSVKALRQMVEGRDLGALLPHLPAAIFGTYPSAYEALPRGRHGALLDGASGEALPDLFDPKLWQTMGWGLAASDQDDLLARLLPDVSDPARRRAIAIDHQAKCLARAKRVTRALDRAAPRPPGLMLFLIAGDAMPTDEVLAVDGSRGTLSLVSVAAGDGTVLRSSALLDERQGAAAWSPRLASPIPWSQVMFLPAGHLGLTSDPAFTDNMLYVLLESPIDQPVGGV